MKNRLKKHFIALVLILCGGLSLQSCKFLDVDEYFYDTSTLDSIFIRKSLLDQYLIGAASFLSDESRLFTDTPDPYQISSDDNFLSWNDNPHASNKFLRDELDQYTDFYANWYLYYKGIRKCNLILERINEVRDMTELEKRNMVGKAYFLRGYYYYLILRQFGPASIVPDKAFDTDAPLEDMFVARSTYEETVAYICKDMDSAAALLEESPVIGATYHQATKGAALAVKSRVLLEQASPFYNGNVMYSDWKQANGQHYIPQTNNPAKWGMAAVAAKAVMETGRYSLHIAGKTDKTPILPDEVSSDNFPLGAGGIDPLHSYADMFNGETQITQNSEFIYSSGFADAAKTVWIASSFGLGGGNGLNMTQSLVDQYRMKDGGDISTSPLYPVVDDQHVEVGTPIIFSGYEIKPKTAKMYVDREPRFYATLGYSHCFWSGETYLGSQEGYKNVELTYYLDGNAAAPPQLPEDRCISGYTLKKYVHPDDNLRGVIRGKVYPIIRYAEILLNYAEALNEMTESYLDPVSGETITRDEAEIAAAFNQVRFRSGMPGLTSAELADPEVLRDLIKRERRVEFVGERMRFFDLRRWGDAETELTKPLTGMNTEAKSDNRPAYYTTTVITNPVAKRYYHRKMNFFPIHNNTLLKNPKLDQNPWW